MFPESQHSKIHKFMQRFFPVMGDPRMLPRCDGWYYLCGNNRQLRELEYRKDSLSNMRTRRRHQIAEERNVLERDGYCIIHLSKPLLAI